jgi:hypothetical protein
MKCDDILCGLLCGIHRYVRVLQCDIVFHRAGKDEHVLWNEGDILSEPVLVVVAHVPAIHQYRAALHVVETA